MYEYTPLAVLHRSEDASLGSFGSCEYAGRNWLGRWHVMDLLGGLSKAEKGRKGGCRALVRLVCGGYRDN